jgi:hypothetical protein
VDPPWASNHHIAQVSAPDIRHVGAIVVRCRRVLLPERALP